MTTDEYGCEAFRRELIENLPHLRRYARALLYGADISNSDDLVQECLARALKNASSYRPTQSMRPWLFTILHNIYVTQVRQSKRRDALSALAIMQPAPLPSPEERLDAELLLSALSNLPDHQRVPLLLVGAEGMSYAATAGILGVPIGTVRSRLSRGRESLHQALSVGGDK